MKVAVRYFSRGGNTKKLANAIAEAVGAEALTTEVPLSEDVDILFLGSSVYAYGVDDSVKKFIAGNRVKIGKVVNFSTAALVRSTYKQVAKLLKEKSIPHQVLNAKFHEIEAEIVAQAGKPGTVTIATNMAGRGTDIMLGGNAEMMARNEVKKKGYSEDVLIESTEHIDLGFILGEPGEGKTAPEGMSYIKLEDMPDVLEDSHIKDDVLPTLEEKLGTIEDKESEEYKFVEDAIEARKIFVEKFKEYYPQVIRDREKVREAGGLKVIGTERHESRRIDNQLLRSNQSFKYRIKC